MHIISQSGAHQCNMIMLIWQNVVFFSLHKRTYRHNNTVLEPLFDSKWDMVVLYLKLSSFYFQWRLQKYACK